MIRRTFRAGLLLGVVAGAAGALKKAIDTRKPAPAAGGDAAWPPMPGAETVTVPEPPAPEQSQVVPEPDPVTEVHEGDAADEHFADTDRQPEVPVPDWTPEAPAGTAPAAPAKKAARPARKAPVKAATATSKAAKPAKPAKAAKKAAASTPWVDPEGDGTCPGSHPVKAKLSSKIFHLPGGFNYPRTRPDRCYIDAAAAEADGLRPSKR